VDREAHKLIADVAVLAGDRVLLVKYRDVSAYDGQRGWFLPDAPLVRPEHPEEGAGRIAREQLGLDVQPRLDHIESFGNGAWHLIFHCRAELAAPIDVVPGDNVLAAEWFPLSALPSDEEMAHDGWGKQVLETMLEARPDGA
jgi:ADP-ribose pyrophosphatase YjhB (NUDIX family)